jgi:ubiquinone/menaquinone biosynthesis C-methylase UbiE
MSLERIEDSADTPWWGEHVQRYDQAITYVQKNSRVLDLACGNGFGTMKLVESGAQLVIGGDVSEEALTHCTQKYQHQIRQNQFEFRKLDATKLDVEDSFFDLVVSFETIEHIDDYQSAVKEFWRILKPGGKLILSTPNQKVSSPDGIIVNPYHLKEFELSELTTLLSGHFGQCVIGGQRFIRYDNQHHSIAPVLEKILYQRGVRKLSLPIRNSMMRAVGVRQLYPEPGDFQITYDQEQIEKCLTFFAVCTK